MNLTDKEYMELRLKCLEPFVTVASKNGIDKDEVLAHAQKAWEWATKPLLEREPSAPIKGI